MTDDELALHCTTEMGACLDELIGRYDKRVRDCARQMSLERDQAEDLVGDIYLRLVASLPRFEGRSAFGTWLFRLAHNTCIDAYRGQVRRAKLLGTWPTQKDQEHGPDNLLAEIPASWGDPTEYFDAQIRECYIAQALARLPQDYRTIVLLRLGEGRSNEEVARILGSSTDSVKAKLQRARRRLKQELLSRTLCPFCESSGAYQITQHGQIS